MSAGRTLFGRLIAFENISAIRTMPFNSGLFLKYLSITDVGDQFPIPGLMEFFNFSDLLKGPSYLRETLIRGDFAEIDVKLGPF